MFKINYIIVHQEWDEDGYGSEGYIQIVCNEKQYGEIFREELYDIMNTQRLATWFDFLSTAAVTLLENNYVAISDIESEKIWIELKREGTKLKVSIVDADKPVGNEGVLLALTNRRYNNLFWSKEVVQMNEFLTEILKTTTKYVEDVTQHKSDILQKWSRQFCNIEDNIRRLKMKLG